MTRDAHLPYSPTILPYLVSGRSRPDKVALRGQDYFRDNAIAFVPGADVVSVDPAQSSLRLASGETWRYDRLLIATGAAPALPPIRGLNDVPFHVLRSMDDAVDLRQAIGQARSAIVLGAGLIGMHAAENMAKAKVAVSVVELQPHVLSGYFEPRASAIIERSFARNGVRMLTGAIPRQRRAAGRGLPRDARGWQDDRGRSAAGLHRGQAQHRIPGRFGHRGRGRHSGRRLHAHEPAEYLGRRRRGAGARLLGRQGRQWHPAERGRARPHRGARHGRRCGREAFSGRVPLNTYSFFGQQAISVGRGRGRPGGGEIEIEESGDEAVYRRIVLEDGRLAGIATINDFVDAGIMWQLILRRTDLSPVKAAFIANPRLTGRQLMSQIWR